MNNTPDHNIEETLELIKKMPEPQRTEILRFVCASIYEDNGVFRSRMQDYYGQIKEKTDKAEEEK